MSADKHRSLARRVAWLRYFSCKQDDGSLGPFERITGVQGYPHITEDLLRLEHEGLVHRGRSKLGFLRSRGYATTFRTTPDGIVHLKETLLQRGPEFGPSKLVKETQGDRPNKTERRKRVETPMLKRLQKLATSARRAIGLKMPAGESA